MSLLDKPGREIVTVFMQETYTDSDGNLMTRASTTGITTDATIQLLAQSGTSSRRAEQDNEGFETEQMYRLRFPRKWTLVLDAQAKVEWQGVMWSVIGKVRRYNSSERTRHNDYMIRRT